jgi:transposase
LSLERVARAQNLSKGVVAKYVKRAAAAGIVWGEVRELDETEFAARLQRSAPPRVSSFAAPDFAWIHQELKKKSVTLQLLWEEYREQCAGRPYGYTSFCIHYRRWALHLKRSMRQVHRAGEKLFVDYAGQTVPVLDASTGEIRQAQVFVAALGASSYTFACATCTQQTVDWIDAHVDALGFLGGCPECVVSDNPRALIANPDRYEPEVGRAYAEFATHYSIAILPARPRKPQDKDSDFILHLMQVM